MFGVNFCRAILTSLFILFISSNNKSATLDDIIIEKHQEDQHHNIKYSKKDKYRKYEYLLLLGRNTSLTPMEKNSNIMVIFQNYTVLNRHILSKRSTDRSIKDRVSGLKAE